MKPLSIVAIAVVILGSSGCMSDRTRNMAKTCQDLLGQDDKSSDRRFIRDAEKQLASLSQPQNRITTALRDIQDHDAMTYKPELEQCLWMIKSRRP